MRWLLGIFLLSGIPGLLLSASPLTATAKLEGRLVGGRTIRVVIPVLSPENDRYASVQRWGSDPRLAPPHYLVGQIGIYVGEKEVAPPVRMSAWADLTEPRQPKLSVNKNGFRVSFAGGDTLFSYLVTLGFSNEGLLLRRTISDSRGKMVFEDTRYSYDDDVLE